MRSKMGRTVCIKPSSPSRERRELSNSYMGGRLSHHRREIEELTVEIGGFLVAVERVIKEQFFCSRKTNLK
ncbi:unnamed protein product [Prunus brigantina]